MSCSQLDKRNKKVDWQIAPGEHEIVNYDDIKIGYRKRVEEFIGSLTKKSIKKKCFVTISTNVMCADIHTSKEDIDPIERDIYLPLEIALTKWSMSDSALPPNARKSVVTKHWLINPGPTPPNCNNYALDHTTFHKIEQNKITSNDNYFTTDIKQIVSEINSLLPQERIVFSTTLRNCRQDLGCLKWLNREVGFKMNPIKVYSIEDLYVVLIRSLILDEDSKAPICQGLARFELENKSNTHEPQHQCKYHRDKPKEDPSAYCNFCAKSMSEGYTHVLLDDIAAFTNLFEEKSPDDKSKS